MLITIKEEKEKKHSKRTHKKMCSGRKSIKLARQKNQSTSTFFILLRGGKEKNSNSETPWMSCERESEKTATSTVGGINDLNCCEYWISFQISANTPTPQYLYIRFCFFLLNGFDCVTIFMELLSIKNFFFSIHLKWNYSNHILETFSSCLYIFFVDDHLI